MNMAGKRYYGTDAPRSTGPHPDPQEEARAELVAVLPNLWRAIVDNTRHDSAFWIGEILLAEITKETGYRGPDYNAEMTREHWPDLVRER